MKSDVALLFGKDMFYKYSMFVLKIKNTLYCTQLELNIHLGRNNGHVHSTWPTTRDVFASSPELLMDHRRLWDLARDKIYNFLRMTSPYYANYDIKMALKYIKKALDRFQRLGPTHVLFKASLPSEDSVKCSEELSMDLQLLEYIAVLQIVDTATRFSAETFLAQPFEKTVGDIWLAFLQNRCTIYNEYPNHLRVDHGSSFTSYR